MKAINDMKNENSEENENNFDFENDGVLIQDEPSISISYYQTQYEDDREHDGLIGQFNLIKLAPIQVQEGINYSTKDNNVDDTNQDFRRNTCNIWCKKDILEEEFDIATNEMLDSSNRIIDYISYNNYYYQCNMFENGTYPSFGTY